MARPKKNANLRVVGNGDLAHDNTTNELTDDQRQALFFRHKNKIAKLKERMASANGDLRAAYKEAKADGILKKEIDFAFTLENDKDDVALQERRRQAEIAKWMGHAIGTQAEFSFDAPAKDTRPIKERAFDEGKRAAFNGDPCTPPSNYSANSEGHQGWIEGWHAGKAAEAVQTEEQSEGESLLMRPSTNETSEPDEFDAAASGTAPDADDSDDTPPQEQSASEGKQWPDDAEVSSRAVDEEVREEAETL